MSELVCRIGVQPDTYRYENVKLERKGFLSVISFSVLGRGRQDLLERGRAAVVLPADFKRKELYMIEQPRHIKALAETAAGQAAVASAFRDGESRESFSASAKEVHTMEFPAGMIDGGETVIEAAVRELREETGLIVTPDALVKVMEVYPSIGGSTERVTGFIARLSDPVAWENACGDGHEQIAVWKMPWQEAYDLLDAGRITGSSANILLRELRIIDLRTN